MILYRFHTLDVCGCFEAVSSFIYQHSIRATLLLGHCFAQRQNLLLPLLVAVAHVSMAPPSASAACLLERLSLNRPQLHRRSFFSLCIHHLHRVSAGRPRLYCCLESRAWPLLEWMLAHPAKYFGPSPSVAVVLSSFDSWQHPVAQFLLGWVGS